MRGATTFLVALMGGVLSVQLSVEKVGALDTPLKCRVSEITARLNPAVQPSLKISNVTPVTGETAELGWELEAQGLEGDTYLVVGMPEATRFKGDGFIALSPKARAPRSIRSNAEKARVLIPLSGPLANPKGTLGVDFYETGLKPIPWEIVELPAEPNLPCAEAVIARGTLSVDVRPGRPRLVTQDRFAEGAPKSIHESNDSRYLLYEFSERYQIIDATTGDLLFDHAGKRPRFSNGGRFVTSFDGSERLEIVDIVAQKLIFTTTAAEQGNFGGVVVAGWMNNDSVILLGYGRQGAVGLTLPLIDGRNIFTGSIGCNACQGFDSTSVLLDFDQLTIQARAFGAVELFQSSLVEVADSQEVISFWEKQDSGERGPPPRRPKYSTTFNFRTWVEDMMTVREEPNSDDNVLWELSDKIVFAFSSAWNRSVKAQRALLAARSDRPRFRSREPAAATTKGRVVRRVVEIGGTRVSPKSDVEKASELLGQFGIRLLPSGRIQEFRPVRYGSDEYEKQTDSALKIIQRAMTAGSASRKLITLVGKDGKLGDEGGLFTRDYSRFSACSDREMDESKEEPPIISASRLISLWQIELSSGSLFIFQQSDRCGTAPDLYGDLISLFVSKDGRAPLQYKRLAASYSDNGEISDPHGINPARSALGAALRLEVSPLLYLNIVDDRYLVIASRDSGAGAVFQAPEMELLKSLSMIENSLDLSHLTVTSDHRATVQLNRSGFLAFTELASNNLLLSGRYVDDELVLYDSNLNFESTPEGAAYIYVSVPGVPQLFTLDQFTSKLRSPGIARKRISEKSDEQRRPPAGLVPPFLDVKKLNEAYVVEARGSSNLTRLRVAVDGRIVKTVQLSGSQTSLRVPIEEELRGRWISFSIEDEQGLRSAVRTFLIGRRTYAGRVNLLAFGADKFNRARLGTVTVADLSFAFKDAQRFETGFKRSIGRAYSAYEGKVLSGLKTDREGLLREIERSAKATGPQDTLVLFFASHGTSTSNGFSLLLPSKVANDTIADVPFALVSSALRHARGRVFVFLDACRSAGATQDAGSEELASTDQNITIIASSKGQQSSLENAGWGGGAFTNAVLAAFKDAELALSSEMAMPLSVETVYAAIRRAVSSQTNGKQTPWFRRSIWVGQQSFN